MPKRFLLAALAVLVLATPAAAEPRRTLVMARVPVDDLDLSTAAGARAMLHRLNAAARDLCAFTPSPLLPRAPGLAWRCRTQAMAQAVERLETRELRLAYAELLTAEPGVKP
ncbi:UrcA family protein [Phenylobacterium sp. VNQ135]|uniref:UrcA family protein n=1 Tax=Phenylobacterium sp. VNQ135 TaxID=3400922 RepID=UPI003C1080E7